MLSYRHGYHAGNAGDVLKHLVLTALLRAVRRKTTPLRYIETHAGAGAYDLTASAALRHSEHDTGIGALWQLGAVWQLGASDVPALVADYLAAVVAVNGDDMDAVTPVMPHAVTPVMPHAVTPVMPLRRYPGSPAIARHWLDPNDVMWLAELHPADHAQLHALFAPRAAAHVRKSDGYPLLQALLPAHERRALVLIDPAYELTGEAGRVAAAVAGAMKRMGHCVCAVWAPLRGKVDADGLAADLAQVARGRLLRCTLDATSGDALGSTMLVINPPFQVDIDVAAALRWLTGVLPHFRAEVAWWGRAPL